MNKKIIAAPLLSLLCLSSCAGISLGESKKNSEEPDQPTSQKETKDSIPEEPEISSSDEEGQVSSEDDSDKHTVRFFLDNEVVKTLKVKDGAKMSAPSSKEFPGYTVVGWYAREGGMEVPWSFTGGTVTSDIDLYADFEYVTYSVKLISLDRTVTRQAWATYKRAYDFSRFYGSPELDWIDYFEEEDGTRADISGTWSITHDTTLYPVIDEKQRNEWLGIDPVINAENATLTYGLYPQTHVSNSGIVSLLNGLTSPKSNGWYLLDGEYYAKKSAKPYGNNRTFDDGATIAGGTEYWFKCEPITWKILSSENDEYSLVSTVLLDAHRYDDSSNNYENSEIRTWLNEAFYNSAFSLGNSCIQTTTVDNSAATTDSNPNDYACGNTDDNVYLLSYQDYLNADYGFSTISSSYDYAKSCHSTDWARANGSEGLYWTRSPYSSSYSNLAWYVGYGGHLEYSNGVSYSHASVRPSLRIKVAQ